MQRRTCARCSVTVLLIAVCAVGAARFAVPTRAQAFPERPDPTKKGLMAMLAKGMLGQPVVALGTGDYSAPDTYDEAAFAQAGSTRERLQIIADAASGNQTFIPFAVRGAWVIAPQTRGEVRKDLAAFTPADAQGMRVLLDRLVLALTPEQMKEGAGGEGIAVSSLPAESQRALQKAFPVPFILQRSHTEVRREPGNVERRVFHWETVGRVEEAPDWSKVRLRVRLKVDGATVQLPEGQTMTLGRREDDLLVIQTNRSDWATVDIPAFDVVPNTFKPSDLDGRALKQPIGVRGVFPMKAILTRLESATGLRLGVALYQGDAPVFVGSETLTCGEVMDGMRLAIAGIWRRVGETFVLASDRRGEAGLQLYLEETLAGLVPKARALVQQTDESPDWLRVAARMPFAADDPLALTDEQRRILLGVPDAQGRPGSMGNVRIPFAELTLEQQAFLREAARTERITISHAMEGAPDEERPYTDADIQNAALDDSYSPPRLELCLLLPGFGWARTRFEPTHQLDPSRLLQIRRRQEAERRAHETPPPQEQPAIEDLPPLEPVELRAATRGVLVPALGPARVAEVVASMKRHRLTTLFYPALDDGYATFPTAAFPLHPALRGADGFAVAASAAKRAGLRFVPYLSPVAWQSEKTKAHWLDKHRDWLDVDPLGRTPLEWAEATGGPDSNLEVFRFVPRNYVRPNEPEVVRRLDVLLTALARKPGASGLLIVDWHPPVLPHRGQGEPFAPPLGFAMADRLAELRATGHDPLDNPLRDSFGPEEGWAIPPSVAGTFWPELPPDGRLPEKPDPYIALTRRVLERAKTLRKDWTTWLSTNPFPAERAIPLPGQPAPPAPPKADRTIAPFPGFAGVDGLLTAIPRREDLAASPLPEPWRKADPAAILALMLSERLKRGAPGAIILDVREGPDNIPAALRWVR